MLNKTTIWLHGLIAAAMIASGADAGAQTEKSTKVDSQAKSAKAAEPKPDAAKAEAAAKAAAKVEAEAAGLNMPKRNAFDLPPEKVERFKKFLPKAFAKLTNRDRFHIVTVGDGDVDSNLPNAGDDDLKHTATAAFANELAMQFYYTGGVRVVKPEMRKTGKKGKAETPPSARLGPEITIRLLSRDEGVMLHAMQTLTAQGFENPVDLVIVSFGLNDALGGVSLAQYAKALQNVIQAARAKGAEVVLVGPALAATDPAEESLGVSRPYADTMREIASDSGVLFVDAGDLAPLVSIPEAVKEPEQIFDQIVKQYRRFFDHNDPAGAVHPKAEFFTSLGNRIYSTLTQGPQTSPWQLSDASVAVQSADKVTLRYQIKNTSDKEETLAVLPLVSHGWRPQDASPDVTLKAGESKPVEVVYSSQSAAFPLHEPTMRLPVLLSGAGMSRIEDVRAEVRPFAFLWKPDTLFNQEKSFALENLLINTSGASLKASWTATWLGQKRTGEASLAAGEKKPLEISFDLPASADPWRQVGPLTMEIKSGAITLHFDRTIEISRNLGLKQSVSLTLVSSPDKAPAASGAGAGVRLKADADANSLFLTYEINGVNIEDRGNGKGAFGYELGIDARSYGKRLGAGAISALRLYGKAADGAYDFETPEPWAFGDGYAAFYDPHYIRGQLSSTASGSRRLTITVPRSYFYNHEWAIGNGNSQIGVRTTIAFWKGARDGVPNGDYPADQAFTLTANGRHRDDAEGLAVLELTEKPTARWTVNPF